MLTVEYSSIRRRTEYNPPTITASPPRAQTIISDHLFIHLHLKAPLTKDLQGS
jgi:hypothetical protein